MFKLVKLGRRTKLSGSFQEGRMIAKLADGEVVGEYVSSDEAAEVARERLPADRGARFCVRSEDGRLSNLIYDSDEQRRLEGIAHWRDGLLLALFLGLLVFGILGLAGLPLASTPVIAIAAASALCYLICLFCQNQLEALLMWGLFFILFLFSIPVLKKKFRIAASPPTREADAPRHRSESSR